MSIIKEQKEATILFSGDSGDGIQLTGSQFTDTAAILGNDISTFPNFPAEIRAPQGTLAGVSGFQVHFGSIEINTPGDSCDVLVAMNAAALKANLLHVKKGGVVIVNTDGFDAKNLQLSGYPAGQSPLLDDTLGNFTVHSIEVTRLTKATLEGSGLGTKEAERCKNMFVLGYLFWMYDRSTAPTEEQLKDKFAKRPELADANIRVLRAGYHFGETTERAANRIHIKKADMPAGEYRSITGNQAVALGLVAAGVKSNLSVFYGSYPITPASDILHELSRHKNFPVVTFQAEDEIAAICAAIGASFGGSLGVTASSGPGIALKTEAMGLALMLELPLVIINVQRGGPSTGLPTKTEQADLLQAIYGRNGESPVAVVAASTPSDCFEMTLEAARLAVEFMTPVILLSDGYIANGAEPWRFPSAEKLPEIPVAFAKHQEGEKFFPYRRNEKLSRNWAIPGIKGLEHRVGGLEKEDLTGNISYDPANHEKMVGIRASKIEGIAHHVPLQTIDSGPEQGKLLVVGWGSTYGVIKSAVQQAREQGIEVSHMHVKYLHPFPANLEQLLKKFSRILVPEMNKGQLVKLIREKFLTDAIPVNKVKGIPFSVEELVTAIKQYK
jgi:2-oxoglutarate ferredoxin oxidoreductase subunit alpha